MIKSISRNQLSKASISHESMVRALMGHYAIAVSDGTVELFSQWYAVAKDTAEVLAKRYSVSVEYAQAVIAALSPRCQWGANVAKAEAFLATGAINGLPSSKAALEAMDHNNPRAALRGRKVTNFYDAIDTAGVRPSGVVVDTWAYRAALGTDWTEVCSGDATLDDSGYTLIEAAYTQCARHVGLTPDQFQAVVWCVVRGGNL